jgi:Rho-binding antiterminator
MDTSPSAGDPGATRAAYRPIDCDVHDRLELAAMHRQELMVEWQEGPGDEAHTGHVRVLDLETRPDGEFLIGQLRSGSPLELRLDRVIRFGPP